MTAVAHKMLDRAIPVTVCSYKNLPHLVEEIDQVEPAAHALQFGLRKLIDFELGLGIHDDPMPERQRDGGVIAVTHRATGVNTCISLHHAPGPGHRSAWRLEPVE